MEPEIIKIIFVLLILPYALFIIWAGSKLFSKWYPLLKRVKVISPEDNEVMVFDLSDFSFWEKVKFFYLRMIIEAGIIIALVVLGVSNKPTTRYAINKHMWRGNWIFILFMIIVSGIFVAPLPFILPNF